MEKKVFKVLIMITVLVIAVSTVVQAASFTVTMTPSSTTVAPETEFTVTIKIANLDVGSNGINSLSGFLTYDTNGLNITKLKGADEYDITEDSAKLEELFEKYMDIVETPCSNIPNNSYTSQYIKREMKCADSVRGFNVGFYLDRQCSSIYNTKDYYQDDATMKYVENACGYIIYSAKKGLGKIGTDFFIIGLGKRGVK